MRAQRIVTPWVGEKKVSPSIAKHGKSKVPYIREDKGRARASSESLRQG